MKPDLAQPSPAAIDQALCERFRAVAHSPEGLFSYPTGLAGLRALDYPAEALAALPEDVLACYCGVGNPFAAGFPDPGETVLDVGCGAGVDTLVAAHYVGASGLVAGLEFSPEMVLRGQKNIRACGIAAVGFAQGRAERLPFADAAFDRVISNGVFNLVQDKTEALSEAHRVLKPGGLVQVADQILESDEAPACQLLPAGPGAGPEARAQQWAR